MCSECGFPSHAGHMTGCTRAFPLEEAPSGSVDEEAFFDLYKNNYGFVKSFNEGTEPHLFVIKDNNGQVVAGAAIEIQQAGELKEAYFRMKVVRPDYESKGLAQRLTQRRIETAKAAGCQTAWAMVGKELPKALRTIFKDGFTISESSTPDNTDYRVSLDLTKLETRKITIHEALSAAEVRSEDDITGEKILIPYKETTLINTALEQGYVGKQLFLPKDWLETNPHTETFLYFEKSQSTTQGSPE